MKKIIAMLLTLLMVCAMTACADTAVGSLKEAVKEKTATLTMGEVSGNTYENTYFGIICELDSDWTYASKEELAAAVSMTAEQMDLTATLEQTSYYMDMAANRYATGASINVGVEKPMMRMTAEEYCQYSVTMLPDQMATMGFTVNECEATTVQIDGRQVDAITMDGTIGGVEKYQTLAVIEKDGRIAIITIATVDAAEMTTILNKISLY